LRSRRLGREYGEVLAVIGAITVAGWFAPAHYQTFGQIYLLAIIALSFRVSRWPALAAALISAVAWNFAFMPPRLSFSVLHLSDRLLLGSYFIVALIGGQFAGWRAAGEQARLHAASDAFRRTLLDSVSHELKTPLAVLRAAADQVGGASPAQRALLAHDIRSATQRLDHLVANLLSQTRLESGTLEPLLDWCDVRDVIAAARRAGGVRLAQRKVTVAVPADMPLLHADAVLMEQVLANLLLNAALHTPPECSIWVEAGRLPAEDRAFVRVRDNGPGIPPESRRRLFEKFRRGQNARPGGLGLGLAIVRGFMQAQAGEVRVETAPGGGASITVLLPLREPQLLPIE
jgi:two-component system sensor histidine kinase KdpD